MVSINCNTENFWLPWTLKNNLESIVSTCSSKCLRSLHCPRRGLSMVLTVITLWQDTSPAFIQSQLRDECQESRGDGEVGDGTQMSLLTFWSMSECQNLILAFLFESLKKGLKYGVHSCREKGSEQQLNLLITGPNRGLFCDSWLVPKMHHLLLASFYILPPLSILFSEASCRLPILKGGTTPSQNCASLGDPEELTPSVEH